MNERIKRNLKITMISNRLEINRKYYRKQFFLSLRFLTITVLYLD